MSLITPELLEQRIRAQQDGEHWTLCPQCRAVHVIDSSRKIGVRTVRTDCECGAIYNARGYGKLERNKRRAKRRRRNKPVRKT